MQYTAIVGKPSEITYYHAEYLISRHAYDLGYKQPIKRIYAVGVSSPLTILYKRQMIVFPNRIIPIRMCLVRMFTIVIYKLDLYRN